MSNVALDTADALDEAECILAAGWRAYEAEHPEPLPMAGRITLTVNETEIGEVASPVSTPALSFTGCDNPYWQPSPCSPSRAATATAGQTVALGLVEYAACAAVASALVLAASRLYLLSPWMFGAVVLVAVSALGYGLVKRLAEWRT